MTTWQKPIHKPRNRLKRLRKNTLRWAKHQRNENSPPHDRLSASLLTTADHATGIRHTRLFLAKAAPLIKLKSREDEDERKTKRTAGAAAYPKIISPLALFDFHSFSYTLALLISSSTQYAMMITSIILCGIYNSSHGHGRSKH